MEQMRAESYAAAVRDPCADGACGRCATTIAGEVVHACLLPAWRGGAGRPLDVGGVADTVADLMLPLLG
jgi:hypothetical protein